MLEQQTKQLRIRLYARLSKDDGDSVKESNSIINQLELGRRWCKENNAIIVEEYVDDGYSGTNFDRPNFKRMMDDIESDQMSGGIWVKDMSRFGRNNAFVMYYVEEILPQLNTTFIAFNDNIDTRHDDGNELMPFKSIINEYYARDTSRKIRSVKLNQALQGKFIGSQAPYGYERSPDDKHVLIIDYDALNVVKKVFSLAHRGKSVHWISRFLHRANLLKPEAYRYHKKGWTMEQLNEKYRHPTYWTPNAVRRMLTNQVYLGHTVSHKQQTKSFKHRKLVDNPKEKWIVVENTHQRIIDDETFDLIQNFMSVKRRTTKKGKTGLFTGLVKCPDCGGNLVSSGSSTKNINRRPRLRCTSYSRNTRLCTSHSIQYDSLYQIVLDSIKSRINHMESLGDDFTGEMQRLSEANWNSKTQNFDKELAKLKKRMNEIDTMIMRLFEQNTLGKISDERFEQMTATYEDEQAQIKLRLKEIQEELANNEKQVEEAQQYQAIISKYENVTTLTREMLCELIESIYVYDGVGKGKERTQRVKVNYRFFNQVSL